MENTYTTKRLYLKIIDRSYADSVVDYYLRNRSFLAEWETLREGEFYTKEYHEKQLDDDWVNIEKGNIIRFWLFKQDPNTQIIGSICFNNIVRGSFLSCHLGYKLDKDEINKGLITEAIHKGIEIVFNDLKLHRIEANIMPRNKRSLRVVEKLGFYSEGLAINYLKINGNWEDHLHMVLLNEKV